MTDLSQQIEHVRVIAKIRRSNAETKRAIDNVIDDILALLEES